MILFIKKEGLKDPPLYKNHMHHTHQKDENPHLLLLYMLRMNQRLNPAKESALTSCLIPPTM